MSSIEEFLREQADNRLSAEKPAEEPKPQEETIEEPVATEPEGDEPQEPVETEDKVEEVAVQTEEPVTEDKPAPKKKLDILEFLESHKDTFKSYLLEKDADYNSLSDVEAVRLKVKKENPELNDNEVALILEDKFSVGIEPIVIDEDNMSDSEIREAKRTNKLIELGNTKLKTEAKSAKSYLNKLKEDIVLPEFEIEDIDPDKIFQEKYNQLVEEDNKRVESAKPILSKGVGSVETINVTYEYEDNGGKVALPLQYKLTDEDKKILVDSLVYRVGKETDRQYLDASGNVDYQKLLNDEGKYYLHEKLAKVAIKEAVMQTRKSLVKDKLVNYHESPKNIPSEQEQKSYGQTMLEMLR